MTAYYKQTEIIAAMNQLVKDYMKECKECNELPEGFVELLKHNFLAKYVCFNEATQSIEIGVEDTSSDGLYPEIKSYKFPLNSKKRWIEKSFKTGKNDLAFYGKLLNRKQSYNDVDVVVI